MLVLNLPFILSCQVYPIRYWNMLNPIVTAWGESSCRIVQKIRAFTRISISLVYGIVASLRITDFCNLIIT